MAVTVKTFASTSEAAGALSADRGARYLGGGTLVMRALNEGDVSVSTVIRASDQARRPGGHHADGGGADLSGGIRGHSPSPEGGRMSAEESRCQSR